MGNHEYYTHDIKTINDFWRSVDLDNFYFLQNDVVCFDNVRIIGSTMWASAGTLSIHPIKGTTISENVDWFTRNKLKDGIQDFNSIKGFSVLHMANIFKDSMRFIFDEASKPFNGKTLVVTHHAPSSLSSLPEFTNDTTNHAFASPLDIMVEDHNIDYWIHGHMHNSSDYMIGNTRIICNPRGYKDMRMENLDFDKIKRIEV
jgi:predicted phosphohydrolase